MMITARYVTNGQTGYKAWEINSIQMTSNVRNVD